MDEELKENLLELLKSHIPENIELALMLADTLEVGSIFFNEFVTEIKIETLTDKYFRHFENPEEFFKFKNNVISKRNELIEKLHVKQIGSVKKINIDDLLNNS